MSAVTDCGLPPITLECYRLDLNAPDLVPAGSRRHWMDRTSESFAYRCTPLVVANTSGWEAILPFGFIAEWSGQASKQAITVISDVTENRLAEVVCSHFGHGILTFKLGWLLRTSPGWAVWARGTPNLHKEGIVPLEGVVETDWLPFSFTMNWRFTRPGRISFRAGEPFCFISILPHGILGDVEPVERRLKQDPALESAHSEWLSSRMDFVERLSGDDPEAVREGWQKKYHRGEGAPPSAHHVRKRKLRSMTKFEQGES